MDRTCRRWVVHVVDGPCTIVVPYTGIVSPSSSFVKPMSCRPHSICRRCRIFRCIGIGIFTPSCLSTCRRCDSGLWTRRGLDTSGFGSLRLPVFRHVGIHLWVFRHISVGLSFRSCFLQSDRDRPTSLARGEGQPTGLSSPVILMGSRCCGCALRQVITSHYGIASLWSGYSPSQHQVSTAWWGYRHQWGGLGRGIGNRGSFL
jgi:hypothetical protein